MHSSGIDDSLLIRLNGAEPLTLATVRTVNELCDRAQDTAMAGPIVLRLGGTPAGSVRGDGSVPPVPALAVVTKWERALRRLERLDRAVIAVAGGAGYGHDCGGAALEALLVADFRIAAPAVRLIMPSGPGGVWPGMALYRLVSQSGAATRRTVLLGAPITASAALAVHLLDEVVDDPENALAELCEPLAEAAAGLAVRRQLMLDAGNVSFEEALGRHLAACDRVLRLTSTYTVASENGEAVAGASR
jgi:isomerase DpgB